MDNGHLIPFRSQGVTIFFDTSYPTNADMEALPYIELTDLAFFMMDGLSPTTSDG
jgi:hypothetical protein